MKDIRLVGLGGTISMRETADGSVPANGAAALADRHKGFAGAEDLALIGGSEVDFGHLEQLTAKLAELVDHGADGIVVTTGTDSIEEVSAWLAYRRRWSVPVVITGSMVTGTRPDSDGPANLADALAVAAHAIATDPLVVFAGHVFLGREVLKVSGLHRDAFDAPGRGPVGAVGGGQVSWIRRFDRRAAHGAPDRPINPVPIVVASLGDDGRLLRLAAADQPAVIIAANGAGNLPPGQADAALTLIEDGTLVVITTRAPDARVAALYGYPGGVATLAAAGAELASGLSPHRARLLVSLGVAQGLGNDGLRALIREETQ